MLLSSEERKGGRLAILADGEYLASVPAEMWYSMPQSLETEISEDEAEELKAEIAGRLCLAAAMRMLTGRSHSERELWLKLRKDYEPEICDAAVARCRELGLTDDTEYAVGRARALAENKRYGPMRIRAELYRRGIDPQTADIALDELDFDFDEAIRYLIENRYYDCLSSEAGVRKMTAALSRMGYSFGDIRRVYDIINEEAEAGE